MIVLKATYGDRDITEIIKSRVNNGKLVIRSNNDICGDPKPGVLKTLDIEWLENNNLYNQSWNEGTTCSIPKSLNRKLGIFYSNNKDRQTYPTIKKSLERIRIASDGVADVFTCLWERIDNNPFPESPSWYKVSSHLTQTIQILQTLYTARSAGEYDYVSFLEHDCLYSEGCFDYPDFEKGQMLCNMNYIGLCKDGWQERNQDDKPLSQITMRFEEAISHFESILPNAILTNSGLVEPQREILEWRSKNPSVHVNHGYHFTSHFSIYSKDRIHQSDPYWGDHKNYSDLFF
jgi:hypothetical protein